MITREVDIVRFLLSKQGDINISAIARSLNLDYKNAHNIVKRLESKGIITIQLFGRSSKVVINRSYNPIIFEAEYKKTQDILKDKAIKNIVDYYVRNMPSSFYVMLLFGSHVKNLNSKHSDIDLIFIIPDNQLERQIQSIAAMIPLKLHVNIFTEKEFIAMKNSKLETVGSEAIKSNIILHGIESYYGMMR